MINIIENAEIINTYLCQIKKSLPLWIRLRKDELNSILDEIEEHIWEKAFEIADKKEPTDIDIQIAISQIGEPKDIAKRFSSESTPYVYINEGLFPFYKKYKKIFVWSFLLWLVILIIPNPFNQFYFIQFSLISLFFFEVIISVLAIITTLYFSILIAFCYMSITGDIPYKLRKSKMQKLYYKHTQTQKPKFYSSFQVSISILEIFFIFFNAIFIFGYFPHILTIFIIIIIKFFRGFIKTKSIVWQKTLILIDICLMGWITRIIGELLVISNEYVLLDVSYILSTTFFLYVCYEMYLFITFKDRIESYLKKLSLIKRIHKKESMLRYTETNNTLGKQENLLTLNKYNILIEKEIKRYLKKIKRNLPLWLKISVKNKIIKDIELEIRENILELEDLSELTKDNIKDLFSNLGSIETRISEYKKPVAPKIFISKELWSWYFKGLKANTIYFITLTLFISILQICFNASFSINSILFYSSVIWLLWMCVIIIITKIFVFLSSNDFVPGKKKYLGKKKKTPTIKVYLFYIWEILFALLYIVIGVIFVFYEIFPKEFSSFRDFLLTLLVSMFFSLLGVMKSLKIIFKGNKIIINSILIIFSIMLSLLISFFDLYNYHIDYRFISSDIGLNLFQYAFLLLNIEIIYEIFHFFFKQKMKSIK
ncbi:MAG: hypothetical protein ACFE9N_06795 [Promethearchaeota archaeon]